MFVVDREHACFASDWKLSDLS